MAFCLVEESCDSVLFTSAIVCLFISSRYELSLVFEMNGSHEWSYLKSQVVSYQSFTTH